MTVDRWRCTAIIQESGMKQMSPYIRTRGHLVPTRISIPFPKCHNTSSQSPDQVVGSIKVQFYAPTIASLSFLASKCVKMTRLCLAVLFFRKIKSCRLIIAGLDSEWWQTECDQDLGVLSIAASLVRDMKLRPHLSVIQGDKGQQQGFHTVTTLISHFLGLSMRGGANTNQLSATIHWTFASSWTADKHLKWIAYLSML